MGTLIDVKLGVEISVIALLGSLCFACAGNPADKVTATEPLPTPLPTIEANKPKTFDDDVASVRYNDYKYIFVLRRKDRAALDGEDGNFIRNNTPFETNQRRMADDGKAVIIGTNFRFYPGQWDALNKQFEFQDLSTEKYEKREGDAEPEDDSPPSKKTNKR
jgi:hypothetical protein